MVGPLLKWSTWLLVCFWAVSWGCVETAMMYRGNLLHPEQQVRAIKDGAAYSDTLETFEVVIAYDYHRTGEQLEIAGQAALARRYPLLFSRTAHLDVYLFFVDESRRVLATVQLARAMTGNLDEVLEFSRRLQVPAGAVGVSFGYNGEVRGGGDGQFAGGGETFWLLPISK